MARSTHETKRAILDAIERLGGEPKQIEIARAIGPQWTKDPMYSRLRQSIRRMVKESVLKTSRRGRYSLHPTFRRRGFDVRDLTVRQIEEFLIERCGMAATADIHEAVGARNIRDGERDAEHKRVTLALAETPEKFCQPHGPGTWALTAAERERLPLPGWWADKELRPKKRDSFFEKVGEAFAEARDGTGMDVKDVTAKRKIRAELQVMSNAAPNAKSEFLREMRREIRAELRAKGVDDEYVATLTLHDREDALLPVYTLLAFEAGDRRLHLVATPDFYRGLAEVYGVDAARLSRGEVIALSPWNRDAGLTVYSRPIP